MTLRERQEVFARNVAKLIEKAFEMGYTVTLGEALRTEKQAEWYAARGIGIVNSLHCKKLAIDLNLFRDGVWLRFDRDYQPLGDFWESLHPANRWGGRFSDGNHFQMRDQDE